MLGDILADGRIGGVDSLGVELGSLPDEVLDQVALVLGEEQELGLLDDLAHISDEALALVRELV